MAEKAKEKVRELIQILESEIKTLKLLNETLREKRRAISELNYDKLRSTVKIEQGLVDKIKRLEDTRLKAIAGIFNARDAKRINLKNVSDIFKGDADISNRIKSLGEEIRREMNVIKKLNDENRYLLTYSLNFTRRVLELVSKHREFVNKKV
jgi:flagellar biosynthesis/type III secretory pathway chaperone